MKKAVIFDLDGTLADTIASITYCGNLALSRFGLSSFGEEDYKHFVGDGAAMLIRRALLAAGDERLEHFDEVYEAYLEIFAKDCMYQVKPYEGICALLEELKRLSVRIAVLSNKPHAQTLDVVERLFGPGTFDMVQGQMEGIPKKPSPKGALHIAAAFSAEPWECLYAGDTNTDMQTGNAAGMFTVGVLWGFRDEKELLDNHAMALLRHPLEMLPYLGA